MKNKRHTKLNAIIMLCCIRTYNSIHPMRELPTQDNMTTSLATLIKIHNLIQVIDYKDGDAVPAIGIDEDAQINKALLQTAELIAFTQYKQEPSAFYKNIAFNPQGSDFSSTIETSPDGSKVTIYKNKNADIIKAINLRPDGQEAYLFYPGNLNNISMEDTRPGSSIFGVINEAGIRSVGQKLTPGRCKVIAFNANKVKQGEILLKADGRKIIKHFDTAEELEYIETIMPNESKTHDFYNKKGIRIRQEIYAPNNPLKTTELSLDLADNKITKNFTYNCDNRLTATDELWHDGTKVRTNYNSLNKIASTFMTEPNGNTRHTIYNDQNEPMLAYRKLNVRDNTYKYYNHREIIHYNNGTPTKIIVQNSAGKKIWDTTFDIDGTSLRTDYDENMQKTTSLKKDTEDRTTQLTMFNDDGSGSSCIINPITGNMIQSTEFDANGKKTSTFLYDTDGKLIKSINFDADRRTKCITYDPATGNITQITEFNVNGSRELTTCDPTTGNITGSTLFNANGKKTSTCLYVTNADGTINITKINADGTKTRAKFRANGTKIW